MTEGVDGVRPAPAALRLLLYRLYLLHQRYRLYRLYMLRYRRMMPKAATCGRYAP